MTEYESNTNYSSYGRMVEGTLDVYRTAALMNIPKEIIEADNNEPSSYDQYRERVNRERMKASQFNPHDDLMTALPKLWPQTFHSPFNEYQRTLIRELEQAIVCGDHRVVSGERGKGNTSILGCSVIWSVLRGHDRFAMFVHGSLEMLSWVRHHAENARAVVPGMGPTELLGDPRCIIRLGLDQAIAVVPNMTGYQHIGLPSLLVVDGNAPNQFKEWTEAKSPRSAFMVQTKTVVGSSLETT